MTPLITFCNKNYEK